MRTKDNELVNRIKLYIEEQIDRRGRMPTIRDIAEALDVKTDDLLFEVQSARKASFQELTEVL